MLARSQIGAGSRRAYAWSDLVGYVVVCKVALHYVLNDSGCAMHILALHSGHLAHGFQDPTFMHPFRDPVNLEKIGRAHV